MSKNPTSPSDEVPPRRMILCCLGGERHGEFVIGDAADIKELVFPKKDSDLKIKPGIYEITPKAKKKGNFVVYKRTGQTRGFQIFGLDTVPYFSVYTESGRKWHEPQVRSWAEEAQKTWNEVNPDLAELIEISTSRKK